MSRGGGAREEKTFVLTLTPFADPHLWHGTAAPSDGSCGGAVAVSQFQVDDPDESGFFFPGNRCMSWAPLFFRHAPVSSFSPLMGGARGRLATAKQ